LITGSLKGEKTNRRRSKEVERKAVDSVKKGSNLRLVYVLYLLNLKFNMVMAIAYLAKAVEL
jgi:hypothetical protein